MRTIFFLLLCLQCWDLALAQSLDPNFTPQILAPGSAYEVVGQADGKLVISIFRPSIISAQRVQGIARLWPNGSLDTTFRFPTNWQLSPFSPIRLQSDGKIIVGGRLTDSLGRYRASLIRLLPNGRIDPQFKPLVDSTLIIKLINVLPNQKIFLSGDGRVLLLSKDGLPDEKFRPLRMPDSNSDIAALGSQTNNNLIIAGTQLRIAGLTGPVFRIDSTGAVDTKFAPQPSSISNFTVQNMVILPDGTLGFLSGDNTRVSIFDRQGAAITTLTLPGANAFLCAASDRSFFLAGERSYEVFANGNFQFLPNISFANFPLGAARQAGNGIVLSGTFIQLNGQPRQGLVRLTRDNNAALAIDNAFTGSISEPGFVSSLLVQPDGKIIIGGRFNQVNNTTAIAIARLLPSGQVDPSFNPFMSYRDGNINQIVQQSSGNLVITSTKFFDRNPQGTLNGISICNANGFQIRNLPYSYGAPSYLAVGTDDKIYVGDGTAFSSFGEGSQGLVRYSATGTLELDYNEPYIDALFRFNGFAIGQDQHLLLFGRYIRYNNSDTTCLVRILPSGLRDLNFNYVFNKRAIASDAIVTDRGEIYVGGSIPVANRFQAFLHKLDTTGKFIPSFAATITASQPQVGSGVSEIQLLSDGNLLISGSFDRYNNFPVTPPIIINPNGQLVRSFFPGAFNTWLNGNSFRVDPINNYVFGSFTAPNGAVGVAKLTNVLTQTATPTKTFARSTLFPNPVVGPSLQLQFPAVLSGQQLNYQVIELASSRVQQSGQIWRQEVVTVDLPNLIPGSYLLRLWSSEGVELHPFSKL